ncbi:hypothetical protein Golob_001502 [Gossypium lobatum]|uniref:Transmembrane protein n=1 Tax=Gossypium lobatum TaxID=34289 RepID=A0A7J8NBQ5_9ROSI|nr:hypothetical protein [Gossypium lobatum]
MKRRVVKWLLFFFFVVVVICSNNSLVHSSSEAVPFISSSKVSGHHYVNPLMEEKQLSKSTLSISHIHIFEFELLKKLDDKISARFENNVFKRHGRMLKTLHNEEINTREDAGEENRKGKGTQGGGDLLRPRARKSGANSLLLKSSPFMLRYLLLIGFHLATIFFF